MRKNEKMKKDTLKKLLGGLVIGIVNGVFGAGGGIIAVPLLEKNGLEAHRAHASSVAVILPLSVFSLILYLIGGRLHFSDGLPYILPGLVGALLGTAALKKISGKWLKRAFGALMIYAGIRMIVM